MEKLIIFVKLTLGTYIFYIRRDKNSHSPLKNISLSKKQLPCCCSLVSLSAKNQSLRCSKHEHLCRYLKRTGALRGKLLKNNLISHQKIVIDWLYPFRNGFLLKIIV